MDFNNNYAKPILTEPGVKYFLNETLKQCHSFKEKYNKKNIIEAVAPKNLNIKKPVKKLNIKIELIIIIIK